MHCLEISDRGCPDLCLPARRGLSIVYQRARAERRQGRRIAAIAALHSIASAQRTYSVTTTAVWTFAQLVQAGALIRASNTESAKFRGYVLVIDC